MEARPDRDWHPFLKRQPPGIPRQQQGEGAAFLEQPICECRRMEHQRSRRHNNRLISTQPSYWSQCKHARAGYQTLGAASRTARGQPPPLLFTATEPLQVFSSLRAKPLLPLPPPVPGQWWLATALILAGYSFPVELQ